ncbi:uncharacterized protein [Bombus fervidus]|uniref:uncharacterized protein n=1 Tax=Bombus fervidus TaxID=203811 RepID=UPI003D189943
MEREQSRPEFTVHRLPASTRTGEERQGLASREGQGSFGMIVKAERVSATRRAKIQERSDNEGRNECQRKGMKRAIYEEYSLKSQDQVGSCEWNTCTVSHLSEKFIVSEIS